MLRPVRAFICSLIVLALPSAAQLPAGFEDTPLITGLNYPVAMAYAPDGRLFVAELSGRIVIYKNGQLLPTPFAQINVRTGGEEGLLGMAVDPNFPAQPYIYIYYTVSGASINPPPNLANRVSRLTAAGDVMAANGETIILDNLPWGGNHIAGCVRFGMDGKLYFAIGDTGNSATSQDLGTLAGKILRVNPDGSVPSDNPFV